MNLACGGGLEMSRPYPRMQRGKGFGDAKDEVLVSRRRDKGAGLEQTSAEHLLVRREERRDVRDARTRSHQDVVFRVNISGAGSLLLHR